MAFGSLTPVSLRTPLVLTTSYVATAIRKLESTENQMILYVNLTKGGLTSAEVLVEFAITLSIKEVTYGTIITPLTVGETIIGQKSGANGTVFLDATGVLTYKEIFGTFENGEIITGSLGGNVTLTSVPAISDRCFYPECKESAGVIVPYEHSLVPTGASQNYRIPIPVKDVYFRAKFKGTGTVTGSLLEANVVLGDA